MTELDKIKDILDVPIQSDKKLNSNNTTILPDNEHAKLMLDAMPFGVVLLNQNHRIINCNEAAIMLLGAHNKSDLENRFYEYSPECQPDGNPSVGQMHVWVEKAFTQGGCVFKWTHKAQDGTLIPSEITLVRIKHKDMNLVAGYMRDLREHKHMMYEIERKSFLLHIVNGVASSILQSRVDTLEVNLQKSMALLAEAAEADRVYVWRNHTRDGKLYCSQIYEWSDQVQSQQNFGVAVEALYEDAVPGWEELLSQGLCINGIVRLMSERERATLIPQGIFSILVVPIFLENQFWGFVGFDDCRSERIFTENDEMILRSASELIAGALFRTRLETEVDKIFYDSLTGIYNRRYFDEKLAQQIKSLSHIGGQLSLMMIDIDHFKQYNDKYGHIEGDQCLRIVAEILQNTIMQGDNFVARYGGEEFVAVLPNTDENGAYSMAQRTLTNIRQRNIYQEKSGGQSYVTVSIGVTTGKVGQSLSGSDFVRRADEMLYVSKTGGRDRYTFVLM